MTEINKKKDKQNKPEKEFDYPPKENPTAPDQDQPWESPSEEPTIPDEDSPWENPVLPEVDPSIQA